MIAFATILARAAKRHGGAAAVEQGLPPPKSRAALIKLPDDRYLSEMCRRIFQAGLKHSLVDGKWPDFETVFHGFVPARVAKIPDEKLEALMNDKRVIRHWPKLKAVPANARAMVAVAREAGSFGAWLADWPTSEIVGLWAALKDRFVHLGGNSGPYFLRSVGKDSFVLTDDVAAALIAAGVVERKPSGKADLARVQQAFNRWAEESGRPLCQISRILAMSAGPVYDPESEP